MTESEKWLQWAVELQALAQAGLYYTKDEFDAERFLRVRDIAAEMVAHKADISPEKVRGLFCGEVGYQTPKLDTRAAIFRDDKVLLVRERNGTWALPGGWVDVDRSVMQNTVKEVKEEAGLDVTADLVVAILYRDRPGLPVSPYKICQVFVLCSLLGGQFRENIETTASGWFSLDDLPPLAMEKNIPEQIQMCLDAHHADHWKTVMN